MQIIQQLRTVPLYISYFLNVVDLHSLQAPFIFKFYSDLKRGIKIQPEDLEIESIRESMGRSKLKITGKDYGAGAKYYTDHGKRRLSTIVKRGGISSPKTCRLLSHIVHHQGSQNIIELGTSIGITTAYLSRAVPEGKIYTFEGNNGLCDIAIRNWEELKCSNIELIRGDINQTLWELLKQIPRADIAIIDANHTKKALLQYYEWIIDRISEEGLIFIDDIRWSVEMYQGWREIVKDPRVKLSIEFLQNGLLVFMKGLSKQHYILSY